MSCLASSSPSVVGFGRVLKLVVTDELKIQKVRRSSLFTESFGKYFLAKFHQDWLLTICVESELV